jgi:hypothetical protein
MGGRHRRKKDRAAWAKRSPRQKGASPTQESEYTLRPIRIIVAVLIGTSLALLLLIVFVPPPREPPTEEELCWVRFEQVARRDPAFKFLKFRYFRGVHWIEGTLKDEVELDQLIALARTCDITRERLDGPYKHSISITIPRTNRSKEYH